MQGDQSRGSLAKAVTVPAVIIDSQEALSYLFFFFFICFLQGIFQETMENVFVVGSDKRQRFREPGDPRCV